MGRRLRLLVIIALILGGCGTAAGSGNARGQIASERPPVPGLSAATAPTETPGALATATPSPAPTLPSPTAQPATRPPTAAPPSVPPTVAPTPAAPAQTRVPGTIPPTPHGLPASDGCLTYGAQPPFVSFVDCVVHALPPGAPVTLTANGEVVFLRIGATVVYPDGSWYFPWSETQHKEIVFVVTAGGVSRSITQVFK